MVAMLNQAVNLIASEDLQYFHHWLRHLVPGRVCDDRMVIKLERILPGILRTLSKARHPCLSVSDLDSSRLFSFSSEEDFKEEKKEEKVTNFVEYRTVCAGRKGDEGTSESPICISDSDDESETFEEAVNVKGQSMTASVSHNEGLGNSEENDYETIGFENNEDSINNANGNKESSGDELPVFCVPQGEKSEEEVYGCEADEVGGQDSGVKGESEKAEGENGEAENGIRKIEGDSGMVRGEKGYEKSVFTVKASVSLEIPDNNKYNILTGRRLEVAYDFERNRMQSLVKDRDMRRSSDVLSGECNDRSLIKIDAKTNNATKSHVTLPNLNKDRNILRVYLSDECGYVENKKKEERLHREKSLKGSSVSQNEISSNLISKKGREDSINDRKAEKLKKQIIRNVESFEGLTQKEGSDGKKPYTETGKEEN